ncbi:MAG: hypothetical protein U1F20_08330 [Lysobacterales bacterium]
MPSVGELIRASADIPQGLGENDVAKSVRSALQAQAGKRQVEADDGEDVLVKKHHGERDFIVTVVEEIEKVAWRPALPSIAPTRLLPPLHAGPVPRSCARRKLPGNRGGPCRRDMRNGSKHAANRLRMLVWGGAAGLLKAAGDRDAPGRRRRGLSATDFIVFATMPAVACGLYELAMRMSGDARHRAAAGVAVATGFITVWANLAVGMIGSEGKHSIWPSPACSRSLSSVLYLRGCVRRAWRGRCLRAGLAQALVVAAYFAVGGDTCGVATSALFVAPLAMSALFRRASQ